MRFSAGSDVYNYNWDQLSTAFWRRYPNPLSSHVLSEDVLVRYIGANGNLITKRLLTKTNRMPKFGEMIVGKVAPYVSIVEESIVDPVSKTLTTYTRNIGMTNIMQVEEKCVYTPDPESPQNRTTCIRQAWITSNLHGVSRAVTKFGIERFKTNSIKASQGFRHVMETLFGNSGLYNGMTSADVASTSRLPGGQAVHQATEKLKEKAKLAKEMAKSQIPLVSAASSES